MSDPNDVVPAAAGALAAADRPMLISEAGTPAPPDLAGAAVDVAGRPVPSGSSTLSEPIGVARKAG